MLIIWFTILLLYLHWVGQKIHLDFSMSCYMHKYNLLYMSKVKGPMVNIYYSIIFNYQNILRHSKRPSVENGMAALSTVNQHKLKHIY